jgi:hypothetical protein
MSVTGPDIPTIPFFVTGGGLVDTGGGESGGGAVSSGAKDPEAVK